MATDTVLTSRVGAVSAHTTVITAALLAADCAAPDRGFRASEVRFFFLLFTNWMEDDLLRPGLDLDHTQIRRALHRLVQSGQASSVGGRRAVYRLAPEGILALVEDLTDPRTPRSFEEIVFLATAARSYRQAIAARVAGAPRSPERIVLNHLDPQRILGAERGRLERALRDLEGRIAAGLELERVAAASPGLSPTALAARLAAVRGGYQLHPMRSLEEVVGTFPPDLARFELGPGMGLRARALFAPLAEQLRARIGILERLEGVLRRAG